MQSTKPAAGKAADKGGVMTSTASTLLTETINDGESRERRIADLSLTAAVTNASTACAFGRGTFGDISLTEAVRTMRQKAAKIKAGDMDEVEATLTAQAATLDVVFNELARRAALNMGQYLGPCETYLRLALKAQAQCRATLETLVEVKYPKAATFVRQQNVAYQQQVNNGVGSSDQENSTRTHAHGKIR